MAQKSMKVNPEIASRNGQPSKSSNADLAEIAAPHQDLPAAEVDEFDDLDRPYDPHAVSGGLTEDDLFIADGEDFDDEETLLTSCSHRQPRSENVFRVKPGKEWRREVLLLDYRGENPAIPRGQYVVIGKYRRLFARIGKKHLLLTCVTSGGQMFLWPVRITEGFGDSWYKSDLRIAASAERQWMRFMGSDGNAHSAKVSKKDWGEPRWKGESILELVRMSFDGRIVDQPTHLLFLEYEIGE